MIFKLLSLFYVGVSLLINPILCYGAEETFFSKKALYVMDQWSKSPDKKISVMIHQIQSDDYEWQLLVKNSSKEFKKSIKFGLNAEILWSQKSTQFAITGSAEGANGIYGVLIVNVGNSSLEITDISPFIVKTFGNPVKCGWPEAPNVAALKWSSLNSIIVIAEIINHSNCDSFGTFKAYDLKLKPIKILREFDQIEAKKIFKEEIGPELVDAPDECIYNPRACWVSSNHPEFDESKTTQGK